MKNRVFLSVAASVILLSPGVFAETCIVESDPIEPGPEHCVDLDYVDRVDGGFEMRGFSWTRSLDGQFDRDTSEHLHWVSDIDGNLGEGFMITTTLTPGTHTITLISNRANAHAEVSESTQVVMSHGSDVINACESQNETGSAPLTNGETVCVRSIHNTKGMNYFHFYIAEGTSQLVIDSEHGSGNATLYYQAGSWPSAKRHTHSADNAGDIDTLIINNPEKGWHYLVIQGEQSNTTLQVSW